MNLIHKQMHELLLLYQPLERLVHSEMSAIVSAHSTANAMTYQIQGVQMELSKISNNLSSFSSMNSDLNRFTQAVVNGSDGIAYEYDMLRNQINELIIAVDLIKQIASEPDFRRAVDDIKQFNDRFDDQL